MISLVFSAVQADISFAGPRRTHVISPEQARQIAQERFGGRALSTTFVDAGDNSAYRVKIIKAGRVRIVTIPAKK
ncbi:MAG: PepSY domain-containing protein [Bdellovibrionota bacterium]